MQNLGGHLKQLRIDKGLSLYKVYERTAPVIPMCLMAGLFDASDIEEYHSGFKNVALLDDEDKQHVQSEIDYILRKRG